MTDDGDAVGHDDTGLDLDVPEGIEVALIAAVAANDVIGSEGGMPWHYPDDMRHFRETTTGHPVVLGRRTHESIVDRIGGPLPDRISVVLSRGEPALAEGARHAADPQEALDMAAAAAEELGVSTVYVAGGGTVYETFLPVADRLVITEIHETYDGDTTFPAWSDDEWEEIAREERPDLSFVEYGRVDRER